MDDEGVVEDVFESGEVDLYGDSAKFYDLVYSATLPYGSKERSARKYLDEGDRVLDLACGTGIVTELLEEDYNVTGVDISREMLEVARNKDLESDFIQADMTDLPFEEEFDAVLMYGQPLSHLESAERANSAANSIYNVLNPEGILISDFFTAQAGKKDDIDSAEIEAGDYSISMFPRFTDYDEENQSWEGSIMFNIQKGNLAQVLQDDHQLRGYSLTQLEKIMSDAGFNGIEEEKIFAGDRVNSFVAYKGSEPKPDQQLGFSL